MRVLAAGFAMVIGTAAAAQTVGPVVRSDLNGDGRAEVFSLEEGDGWADLVIEGTGGGVVVADRIAWMGGIGQQPELTLAPNGSVQLASMNEAIGRSRWHLTLTIAFRNGAYRVAGVTYDWYDTLDVSDNGSCDLNLLSGKGTLDLNGSKRGVRTPLKAVPVTEWKDDVEMPPAGCR